METIDNRSKIYELDEIYKYKNLIEPLDKETIKKIIFDEDEKSTAFYNEFMDLVAKEIDHKLNKTEFSELKDKLIIDMQAHLDSKVK